MKFSTYQKDKRDILGKLARIAYESGKLIGHDAIERLSKEENPEELLKELIEETSEEIILLETVEKFLESKHPPATTGKRVEEIPAKEYDAEIEIIKDPGKESYKTLNADNYVEYYRSRLRKIRAIFARRGINITARTDTLARLSDRRDVSIIGVVLSVKETRTGGYIVEISDEKGTATLLFKNDRLFGNKCPYVLPGYVIMVHGVKAGDMVLVNECLLPDIIQYERRTIPYPLSIAFTSDFHIGSKYTLQDAIERFLRTLNLDCQAKIRMQMARIKYLLVAGDLVDGIGVYPSQEKNLIIKDVAKQYEEFAKIIERIPDYIEVVIIPGNHDTTFDPLPQPPILKEYSDILLERREIIMLSNPSVISLHGIKVLMYHGQSFDSLVTLNPHLTYERVDKILIEIARIRHLAPDHTQTPVQPLPEDTLVIEEVPHIIHTGHLHKFAITSYKGVFMLNSSAWQRQTDYQARMGLKPEPCKVPIFEMDNWRFNVLSFV